MTQNLCFGFLSGRHPQNLLVYAFTHLFDCFFALDDCAGVDVDVVLHGLIGFINERDEAIQFIRFEEDDWLIDVPILQDEKYVYSLQDDINHSLVKEITIRFFQDKEWKNLCHFRRV